MFPELAVPLETGKAGLSAVLPAIFFLPVFQTLWAGTRHNAATNPREQQHLVQGGAVIPLPTPTPALTVAGLFHETWLGGWLPFTFTSSLAWAEGTYTWWEAHAVSAESCFPQVLPHSQCGSVG